MKKILNKIKVSLAILWVAVVSFFSKVIGEFWQETTLYDINWKPVYMESLYGVSYPDETLLEAKTNLAIKIAKRAFVGITFIVWMINLIKIKKTDDKVQRKKRIRRSIIIISILVVLLVAAFLLSTLFLK